MIVSLRTVCLFLPITVLAACNGSEASLQDSAESRAEVRVDLAPAIEANRSKLVAFESGQVRPLALSPNGRLLFAANTPDNRLEIFRVVEGGRLIALGSALVGLEPVALAARSDGEVWVVNHLSDSVSVVQVSPDGHRARVVRTLLVGDEPRDIVFAGPDRSRAFITAAHRGQNTGRDPQLTTPGVGRADVFAFDATSASDTPLGVITLFTDTPRALAVSADGATVYAAGFHTGNRTTTINERLVTNLGGLPGPLANAAGVPGPWAGLIVRHDGQHWVDGIGRVWDPAVNFSLPDQDVFAIDALATPPAAKSGAGASFAGVGTVLFNMAVNPVSGKVYVTNTEARNEVRFEGHNELGDGSTVRGHIAESRITVLSVDGAAPRHLNKHLDYSRDGTPEEAARSLAFPTDLTVSSDGRTIYVAAFGSARIGVFSTREIEDDSFVPSTDQQIALSGGGPAGVVLDEAHQRLYVLTRFDNSISVVDTQSQREIEHLAMYNPEPPSIVNGRRFLYDARLTSSHGDSACASCHVFGDFDSLAWDLGNPDGGVDAVPGPFTIPQLPILPPARQHSLKGPMTTQSLRGMANHGPMHWRGDRNGGNDVPAGASAQPDTGTFDEQAAFTKFNVAFPGLLGRAAELSPAEMQAFTDFILQVTYPPNPIRNLDNSLTADQAAGRAFYFNHLADGREIPSDTFRNCNGCHTLDPAGNAAFGVEKPGFFGSDGRFSFESEPQFFKVPHLRNLYQKVGMFGMANTWGLALDAPIPLLRYLPAPLNNTSFQGPQVRGFGFLHDGSLDTLFRFFGASVFVQRPATDPFPNVGGIPPNADGMRVRRQLEAFVLAFDSNLAPIVGQQVTLRGGDSAAALARANLLEQRAGAGECDLVARDGTRGFLYQPDLNTYRANRAGDAALTSADLRARARRDAVTLTCAPRASGERIGIDRDLDGVLDGDESDDDEQ